MQRRYMLLGLVLVAVVAAAMPALGASPLSTAKKALRIGKKANKTAKKADRRARRALKQIKGGVPEADHATSADNATRATNATNSSALGGVAASDYRRYTGTLQSGKTVVGAWGLHGNNLNDNEDVFTTLSFPLPSDAFPDPHFAPSAFADEDDPSCTGSVDDPTAPPRIVCIYLGPTHVDVDGLVGAGTIGKFGFSIRGTAVGPNADVDARGTWAYTEP